MTQDIAGLVQNLAEWHRDQPQVRENALSLRHRQRSQQMILLWIVDRIGQGGA